jgi:hypothetical protein
MGLPGAVAGNVTLAITGLSGHGGQRVFGLVAINGLILMTFYEGIWAAIGATVFVVIALVIAWTHPLGYVSAFFLGYCAGFSGAGLGHSIGQFLTRG